MGVSAHCVMAAIVRGSGWVIVHCVMAAIVRGSGWVLVHTVSWWP